MRVFRLAKHVANLKRFDPIVEVKYLKEGKVYYVVVVRDLETRRRYYKLVTKSKTKAEKLMLAMREDLMNQEVHDFFKKWFPEANIRMRLS